MLLPSNRLTNGVFELLIKKPLLAKQIQRLLGAQGLNVSTSGLYKTLDKLEAQGIILKSHMVYSISNEWKKSLRERLSGLEDINLKDGERITFDLKSASQTDKHWKHYAFLLEKVAEESGWYFYNPHQLWIEIPDRRQSEIDFINYTKEEGIAVYHTIGKETKFDKEFKKIYGGGTYQINLEEITDLEDTDNITITGDYLINTKIESNLFRKIDDLYSSMHNEEELRKEIGDLITKPARYRFTLERNHKKAERLKKRLGKHFHVQ